MKRKNLECAFLTMFILVASLTSCNNEVSKLTDSSGVNVTGHFDKGSKLVVTKIEDATREQKAKIYENGLCVDYDLHVYDISIQKDNVKIEPNGKTKVTIDFPNSSSNGHRVFHFKNDGDMEVLEVIIKNKKLSFETNSFSIFIIGENKPEIYNYDITYNLNGGGFASDANIINKYSNESSFPLTLPIPTKESYIFKGWENAYGIVINEIDSKMRGNLVLTAKWSEALYTISEDEKIVTFGSYPQNLISDKELVAKLNENISALPKLNEHNEWNSFNFYSKNKISHYSWYKDVEYDGNKYRAVYFNSWRLKSTEDETTDTNWDGSTIGNQMGNGVKLNTIYWFKFTPLKWRVLKMDNEKAFLMCQNSIYAMQFQHDLEMNTPSDYSKSDIRAWLNNSFYNLAFAEAQQDIIATTLVDNSVESADAHNKEYTYNQGGYGQSCEDTNDKVFLLSINELTNKEYGFSETKAEWNRKTSNRSIWWTEYAKYLGGLVINSAQYYPNCDWWSRSPIYFKLKYENKNAASLTDADTYVANSSMVNQIQYGVVPALWIEL